MATAFSTSEVAEFRRLFSAVDSDGSGKLDVAEVMKVMADIGEKVTEAEVRAIIAEVDVNGDNEIDFQEFLAVLDKSRGSSAAGAGGGNARRFSGVMKKAGATIYKIQGAANSEHSIAEEEKVAFAELINRTLGDDPFLSSRLPMDPNSDELFEQCADGIIFAKLVNMVDSEAVDERALNMKKTKKLSKFQAIENCNLAINAAKSIGCQITNIGATDLIDGRPHLVLGIAWQIIKATLLCQISLTNHPELFRLLEPDETLEALQRLPPEQILLRWVNFHLKRGGSSKIVHNFGGDFKDSEAYSILLHQLDPAACPLISGSDNSTRATQVVANAGRMGVQALLKPADIVKGNTKLNMGFLAQLFNTNPGLDQLDEAEMADIGDQLAGLEIDDAGDTREERTFRMWLNSLNISEDENPAGALYVDNLFADLCNGLPLLQVMDRMEAGVNWKKVHKKPKMRHHQIDNCNTVVDLGRKMDLVLVNIGGVDIADGNKKLILAIMWQLMRQFTLDMLKNLSGDGTSITEDQMVQWANNTVAQSGKATQIRNLSDSSLSTGAFLIDLCAAVAPNAVDWEIVTPGANEDDKLSNAKYCISIARKIGACVFLTPEDIVEIKPKMIFTFIGALWTTHLSGGASAGVPSPSSSVGAAAAAAAAEEPAAASAPAPAPA
eukprot:CAMPEP_0119481916 /NCGR_PEP_ID=MMETSP1344-20130328/10019_1 /TAXON_ID=236787 /ORGANISM="Florenciella parvula, Strain CCMP2471" /LENGTH=665 /DNA_ID=CAMNT_0007516297 /DNA_START=158 /DNA_END=2151 /DNA_ORIENTATION=-